jgi:hypothetical protein
MITSVNFWSYLAQFRLEWEMFRTEVVENKHTRCMFKTFFFRKSCRLWDIVGNSCSAGQVTNGNITRRMRTACWIPKVMQSRTGHRRQYNMALHIACWIPKATNTHSEFLILIAFSLQKWLHECASVGWGILPVPIFHKRDGFSGAREPTNS